MEKKEQISAVKWNGKNKIYLRMLGFIDPRSGRVKTGQNLSGFINECVTSVCESGMHLRSGMANPEDLLKGWTKHRVAILNKRIDDIRNEITNLVVDSEGFRVYKKNKNLKEVNDFLKDKIDELKEEDGE